MNSLQTAIFVSIDSRPVRTPYPQGGHPLETAKDAGEKREAGSEGEPRTPVKRKNNA
jgi:hypothetical protein